MIKYVWHLATLMIVFCWLSSARSASYQEQQLNGLVMDQKPQQQQNRIQQASSGTSPGNFLQDHTLQIKFPDLRDADSNSVEGRKKKDKKGTGAYIMIPLLLGVTFVPIAYGALAMLAVKALIVSKLALVLASIIGIKKLLSGGGGGKESSYEVVVSGSGL
ncbi:uncharacterized protein [Drosophila tropicalis]|uniref:uncharacterized protein n=1 Tax=Drosophila tropicalis TaxID=46794 RepID=UPI0035AB6D0A